MRSRASISLCPWPPRRYRATSLRARTAWVMSSGSTSDRMISGLLDLAADGLGELGRRRRAAEIRASGRPRREDARQRVADARRRFARSPMWSSISSADSSSAVGLARFCPAMSGALPCTASNTADVGPMFAPGHDAETADQARRRDPTRCRRTGSAAAARRTSPGASPGACTRRRRSARRRRCRECARDRAAAVEEQAVAQLHDVRLVDRGDPLAAVRRARTRRRTARCASRPSR